MKHEFVSFFLDDNCEQRLVAVGGARLAYTYLNIDSIFGLVGSTAVTTTEFESPQLVRVTRRGGGRSCVNRYNIKGVGCVAGGEVVSVFLWFHLGYDGMVMHAGSARQHPRRIP